MPTVITHPSVAIALCPILRNRDLSARVFVTGMICTVIPDLDVIGFRLGIAYEAPLGHRGFSHSLFFAALLAAILTAFFRTAGKISSVKSVFLFLFLCTASHGFLDAMTNGGYGIAFWAPFSNERYFLPWRPIEVSPLSIARFLSGQAWHVLASEFKWVVLPWLTLGVLLWVMRKGKPQRPA